MPSRSALARFVPPLRWGGAIALLALALALVSWRRGRARRAACRQRPRGWEVPTDL